MRVYTDAARDDDVAGMGWEIVLSNGETHEHSRYLVGNYTSMEAEYFALLDGLRYARRHDENEIEAYCDCKPLVQKMRVPDGNSQDWYERRRGCHRLLNKFDEWELEWMPRGSNETADRLAYEALEAGRRA